MKNAVRKRRDRTRTMATIPDRYNPHFAELLDRRTAIAKAIYGRIEAIETDLGGTDTLSHGRRSLVRRIVWLEAVLEHNEQRLATGAAIDLASHTQAIGTLLGLYRLIGLARHQRPVETLHDVMTRSGLESERTAAVPDPEAMLGHPA